MKEVINDRISFLFNGFKLNIREETPIKIFLKMVTPL